MGVPIQDWYAAVRMSLSMNGEAAASVLSYVVSFHRENSIGVSRPEHCGLPAPVKWDDLLR